MKRQHLGFTFVELVIILAILGLVAGLAIPSMIREINNNKKIQDITYGRVIGEAALRIKEEVPELAQYENHAIVINGLIETTSIADPIASKFNAELLKLLNNEIPKPSYKWTSLEVKEDSFILSVKKTGVEVYVGEGLISDGTALMIYPTPHPDYNAMED